MWVCMCFGYVRAGSVMYACVSMFRLCVCVSVMCMRVFQLCVCFGYVCECVLVECVREYVSVSCAFQLCVRFGYVCMFAWVRACVCVCRALRVRRARVGRVSTKDVIKGPGGSLMRLPLLVLIKDFLKGSRSEREQTHEPPRWGAGGGAQMLACDVTTLPRLLSSSKDNQPFCELPPLRTLPMAYPALAGLIRSHQLAAGLPVGLKATDIGAWLDEAHRETVGL